MGIIEQDYFNDFYPEDIPQPSLEEEIHQLDVLLSSVKMTEEQWQYVRASFVQMRTEFGIEVTVEMIATIMRERMGFAADYAKSIQSTPFSKVVQ